MQSHLKLDMMTRKDWECAFGINSHFLLQWRTRIHEWTKSRI